jgi:hypothetical protein
MGATVLALLATCTKCGAIKPHTDFYSKHLRRPKKVRVVGSRNSFISSGEYRGQCKACTRVDFLDLKARTPPEQWLFDRVRHRARAEGIEFTISVEDVFIPTHCPILGIELARPGAGQTIASPTLDRTDSTRGYVPGNVAVISRKANTMKADGTAEQHERIAAWMRAQGCR